MATMHEIRMRLVDAAKRYSRAAGEVEDLAHDIVLAALRRGVSLDGETFLRSAHAASRKHGAFLARSAARRRAREGASAAANAAEDDVDGAAGEGAPLSVLAPALRTTLQLLVLGLEKAELRVALGVTDAALRKRFQALRKHGPLARPAVSLAPRTRELSELRRSQVRLLPQLAGAPVAKPSSRLLAISDPDGHGFIFAEALTRTGRTATPYASNENAGTRRRRNPC